MKSNKVAQYQNSKWFRDALYGREYRHLDEQTRNYQQFFHRQIHDHRDLLEIASTRELIAKTTSIPLLVIHAEDDFVVSVENSEIIAKIANDNEMTNVLVMIVPDGGHIAFQEIDPNWTFSIVYGFHHYYAYPKNRDDFQPVRKVSALWYYFDRVFDFRQAKLFWTLF